MICAQCVFGLCLHCALAFGRCGKLLWSVLCSCARFVLVLCFGVRALWLAVVVGVVLVCLALCLFCGLAVGRCGCCCGWLCARVRGFVLVLWLGGRASWLLLWLVLCSCALLFVLVLWLGGRALWLLLWLVLCSCAWRCAWRSGVVVSGCGRFCAS